MITIVVLTKRAIQDFKRIWNHDVRMHLRLVKTFVPVNDD